MKKARLVFAVLLFSLSLHSAAFAAGWQQNETGWWWQNDDGSYPSNIWQWLDGNQDGIAESYCFDENGYLYTDTVTPDGFQVNENGAWILDGVVQTRVLSFTAMPALPQPQGGAKTGGSTQNSASKASGGSSASSGWEGNYPYVDGFTADPSGCRYVVNTNTGKVHRPSCASVKDMASDNTRYYSGSFSDLTNAGYSSCGRCHAA